MRHRCITAAINAACFLAAAASGAATFDWNNTGSGTFSNAANWTPVGGPPGAVDTARFALGSTVSSNVTFSGNANVSVYTQNLGNVTLFMNGWTLQATAVNFSGMGADNATSTLRLTNGVFQPAGFTVGGNTGSNSTLTLDSFATMIVSSGVFQVGNNGTGTLILQNGAQLTTNADTRLATGATGVGTATINGTNSSWSIPNNTLRIGVNNDATVNVLNGGTVTANALEIGEGLNTNGSLNVSGANATFITNGTANIGGLSANAPAESATLNVGAGATVNLNGTTNLRTSAILNVSGGTLNLNALSFVAGASANWTAGTVNFANGSGITPGVLNLLLSGTSILGTNQTLSATAGTFNLTSNLLLSGGKVIAPDVQINAHLTVGAFASVIATNSITIESGRTVQIENFGSLAAGPFILNNGGVLQLNGPTAVVSTFMANNSGLIQGTGRFAGGLNNGTGGTIRVNAGDHIIVQQSGLTNPGAIELAGGTIEYTHALSNLGNGFISGRGVFKGGTASPGSNGLSNIGVIALSAGTTDFYGDVTNSGAGRIVAAGGAVVTFYDDVTHNGTEIRTNNNARSVFFGAVSGAGPFTGAGTVEFNGDLKPGNSSAEVAFSGDLELGITSGLEIELGGTVKGNRYDALSIAGTAMLSGTLSVSLINGFVPQTGDTFEIITAADGIGGVFDTELLPALGGGLSFDVRYDTNAVTLAVIGVSGDYNYDGHVDAADYVIWRKTLSQVGQGLAADGNNSGTIDSADYIIWTTHLGEPGSGAGGNEPASVPEPVTPVWLVVATIVRLRLLRSR